MPPFNSFGDIAFYCFINLKRTDAAYLDHETFKKYEKYLVGRKWYND